MSGSTPPAGATDSLWAAGSGACARHAPDCRRLSRSRRRYNRPTVLPPATGARLQPLGAFSAPASDTAAAARIVRLPQMERLQRLRNVTANLQQPCTLQQGFRWHAYSGAGLVLSVGLMRQLHARRDEYEACVAQKGNDYGDSVMSYCLFKMGFAPTVGGTWEWGWEAPRWTLGIWLLGRAHIRAQGVAA